MQERGIGGGRSLYWSQAQTKSLSRMLRAEGPTSLELTERGALLVICLGFCVSLDLTCQSLDSSVCLPVDM